jgi:hypothetical protein
MNMKTKWLFLYIFIYPLLTFADDTITNRNGQLILLKEDHSWIYIDSQFIYYTEKSLRSTALLTIDDKVIDSIPFNSIVSIINYEWSNNYLHVKYKNKIGLCIRQDFTSEHRISENAIDKSTFKQDSISSHTKNIITKYIKFAEDAVEVWDKSINLTEVNYQDAVALHLHYKNNTDKKVIGVAVFVSITNAFGKVVYQNTYEDEVVIEPKEQLRNDTYWHFDNNQFISGEPYDYLWQMAQNGTAKISTSIRKVIFEDGSILYSKSRKK